MRQWSHLVSALAIPVVVLCASACSSAAGPGSDMPGEPCAADVRGVPTTEANPEIVPPTATRRVEPQAPQSLLGRTALTTVEAIIGEDGRPRNICVTSGDPDWGRAVAAALRKWEFKPATLQGKPIAIRFTLTSSFRS